MLHDSDTANNYQDDDSENWIGEWMKERKNRDSIVLATKFTVNIIQVEKASGADTLRVVQLCRLQIRQRKSTKPLWKSQTQLACVHPRLA